MAGSSRQATTCEREQQHWGSWLAGPREEGRVATIVQQTVTWRGLAVFG